jgi:hypothetical protein
MLAQGNAHKIQRSDTTNKQMILSSIYSLIVYRIQHQINYSILSTKNNTTAWFLFLIVNQSQANAGKKEPGTAVSPYPWGI